MRSASPTGHLPRSPASTPSGSHLRYVDVATPLKRVVRQGHAGMKVQREMEGRNRVKKTRSETRAMIRLHRRKEKEQNRL